jgi:RNA polymerase sigma-70 factor (sigma-E family)
MRSDSEFEEFAADTWTELVRSAALLGHRGTDAEDVAQAALIKAYLHWPRVRAARNPRAYVYRILVNVHRSSFRREIPTEHSDDGLQVADKTSLVANADVVARALLRLNVHHRTVIVLHYYADLSVDEVAATLRVSSGTVKSRLSRGRQRLLDDQDLKSEFRSGLYE